MELFALASLALVAGIVSFTSPCTLPLLPGYVSFVSGLGTPAAVKASPASVSRAVVRDASGTHSFAPLSRVPALRDPILCGALLFVVGFSAVFMVLGATASGLGLLLAQNRAVINQAGGAFIIVMGLATAGVLRAPLLHRQLRFDFARIGRGPGAAPLLGAAFAFGWTPCVGPVLAAILTTAAGAGTLARGAVLLLAYSVGLGIPFVFVALGVRRGRLRLGWLQRNSRRIQVIGGLLLVVMGVTIATGSWTELMSGMLSYYARWGWPPI